MDLKTLSGTPPWDWPRDAKKIFKKALLDRNAKPEDRLIAADLAGDLVAINDELAGALLQIVGSANEPDDLRGKSAISLGPVLEQADIEEFEDPDEVPISEDTFDKIQDTLESLYADESQPKLVRRKILEASVRAFASWHEAAIRAAYASGDREWMLTAVFAMRYVDGFDAQILEALKNPDPEIHFEAVEAAGSHEVAGAWPHVVALVEDPNTTKALLLAAIGAVATIRPAEARSVLSELTDSGDEEIEEALTEAIDMAEVMSDDEDDEDDEEEEAGGKWIN